MDYISLLHILTWIAAIIVLFMAGYLVLEAALFVRHLRIISGRFEFISDIKAWVHFLRKIPSKKKS